MFVCVLVCLQDQIQIAITIFHYFQSEVENSDVGTVASQRAIDFFTINRRELSPSDPPTPLVSIPTTLQQAVFSASFDVECVQGFFGPDCDMMCESRDDSLGHFTCDPETGLKACLEGYVGVESNCTECKLSPGCCESM